MLSGVIKALAYLRIRRCRPCLLQSPDFIQTLQLDREREQEFGAAPAGFRKGDNAPLALVLMDRVEQTAEDKPEEKKKTKSKCGSRLHGATTI